MYAIQHDLQEKIDQLKKLRHKYYIYDIEVYPNIFTFAIINPLRPEEGRRIFEVSERVNDLPELLKTLRWMARLGHRLVGFNNMGYDYPIVHYIIDNLDPNVGGASLVRSIYYKSMSLINTPFGMAHRNIIYGYKQHVKQVDLFKIHHFDNQAKMTGLKMLEFNMRSKNIRDLPYAPGTVLEHHEMDVLREYNMHDVAETLKFFYESLSKIAFREHLTVTHKKDTTNSNDMKIGTDFFIRELESRLGEGICFENVDGQKMPRQTIRDEMHLKDVIFGCIQFESPEFNSVKAWIESQTIRETKGVFTDIPISSLVDGGTYSVSQGGRKARRRGGRVIVTDDMVNHNVVDFMNDKEIEKKRKAKVSAEAKGKPYQIKVKNLHTYFHGFRFDFGTGGLHGSIESQTVYSDIDYVILDLDVKSYYPSIVVHNRLFPEHLGVEFADIYNEIMQMRFSYASGTPENAMLKLALNAAGFGATNNAFSPFYDPQMTMTVTINGQLMLCMLAEQLMTGIESLQMIQANTDGITVRVKRSDVDQLQTIWHQWEGQTGMILERNDYSRMIIRDVNSYLAEYEATYDGNNEVDETFERGEKVKAKGAFGYKLDWHQNHSSLVVQKAAENALIHGGDVSEFIMNHDDPFDFMLRTKVPRTSQLLGIVDRIGEYVEALPSWYSNLKSTDRYAIEEVGIAKMLHIITVSGNELKYEGVKPVSIDHSIIADLLGINVSQLSYGLRWYEEAGTELPRTVDAEENQRITRYYISIDGVEFKKVMPALKDKPGKRYLSVNTGFTVSECNDSDDFNFDNVNYEWYIDEAMKLVSPVITDEPVVEVSEPAKVVKPSTRKRCRRVITM